ncbi:DUF1641 domain-containing protein [Caldifermentibacillus hisashii]|jgi:uncharacterized protein YjgD (DUF1641 family)|uniref:DUF1641 domain-containing protein n=1 Tax=Caldifermentibacillus hisashii TaxID=996558 RepID=A0ABU9JY77_9BACI|nr:MULTISPECIES: DUF1641 domain-containing protein [Bacillaceae]MCB5934142.1 DUF1641 domain-containing protein [Bacillus sp. DFI.2.34]NWN98357.1 DUF1641 domain-containing protein [Bacillus sp. (in: firmicutes)]AWI11804.1 DUF1641 domain-containing protein [Caldibacillus thermoamylovorans]MCB7069475.1 DUF1641 domain-containing protein [Caldibacillus sp. 210928-DFI.2.22]MCB7072896.1 DUF1641 domain-containing protein [Caldibacillus sp. 210928-DFI.2.18]
MSNVMEDGNMEKTLPQGERDLLDQLLKPEVQQSLTVLVEQLPKLTELITVLTKNLEVVKSLVTDEVLKEDTVGAIKEVAEPVIHSAKHLAANVIEAKDRAEESQEVIGIFGLLKLLKDPQAQKMLRFLNAFLKVAAEKEHK